MPDVIHLLPDSVANQIAAGEVIQRPASVVKELMENAVDANAGYVSVIIKDAGKTLIQVIDDGTGMSETDARLAFERHATSKISCANDLFAITTKGFRGEALASIAAVAMVELKTRKEEDDTGTLIIINGSKVETQEPCSCMRGSGFSVKNLFYNIPARRKFLKSDNTETRHIIVEFQKIAIAHPAVRFSLHHNESEIYNLPPAGYRQRIIGIFGKQINQDLIPLETDTSLVTIRGFIGKPENARKTYGEQFFFVNNRFMKHPYFHKAVVEGYSNILSPEAVPSYFIFMEADPATIDINIHPTKTEIKFEDERAIWQILLASVREALGRFSIVPSLDFESGQLIEIPVRSSVTGFPDTPPININTEYNPFSSDDPGPGRSPAQGRFERERTAGWEQLYSVSGNAPDQVPGREDLTESSRKFFQIRHKYVVCPVKSGLMLIDQKRAHERILYERYIKCLENNLSASQTRLFPVLIELNPADIYLLKEIDAELRMLGFDIEYPEVNKISVSAMPAGTGSGDPSEMMEIILEDFKNSQSDPSQGVKEKVAVSMAGAAAIQYGRPLSLSEMEVLFDTLFACSAPNYSPRGKPVINIITLDEIDKRYK
ncbi:MAG: DNA mismatch repair endonuclease MutL [Bacteroidales bacterium]